MALRKHVQLSSGLLVDCYCRISTIQVNKHSGYSIGVAFHVYQEGADKQGALEAIHHDNYFCDFVASPAPQAVDVLSRGYMLLKSMQEFSDAVDV